MSEELKAVELVRELREALEDLDGDMVPMDRRNKAIDKADTFLDSVGYKLSPTASAPEVKPELNEDEAHKIFKSGWLAGFKHEDQDDAWVECRKLLAAQKGGQNG